MKTLNCILILILGICLKSFSQIPSYVDSLSKVKSGYCYSWGLEHAIESICLFEDTNIFSHLYMEHLLAYQCYGTYEFKGDTLILKCTDNCNSDFKGIGPIVIPMYDGRFNDTVIINSSDRKPHPFFGKALIDSKNSFSKVSVYYQDKILFEQKVDTIAEYFVVELGADFVTYETKKDYSKKGLIIGEKLILDGKEFQCCSKFAPYKEPEKRNYLKEIKTRHNSTYTQ